MTSSSGPSPRHSHAIDGALSRADDQRIFAELTEPQAEAVRAVRGPLLILAGAGSGKTRVISRRAAYAIAVGAVDPSKMLLVTFTDKAAKEMSTRLTALGHPGVMVKTFHAMALSQLRYFWPSRHGGSSLPDILDSKVRLLVPIVRSLGARYEFTKVKDVASAIEWAKIRRIQPDSWLHDGDDRAPLPGPVFALVYAAYEREKDGAGLLDFEDMLVETVRLLESDSEAADLVRGRKHWFSVDEFQDTSPLAYRLLTLWLGESRDLAVVGDPDQTIFTFTGASSDFLLRFPDRYPSARVVRLLENHRSTPQVIALANRLTGPGVRGELRSTRSPGPEPVVRVEADGHSEVDSIVSDIERLLAAGMAATEVAILTRVNAQINAFEYQLARAGIPFRSEVAFFERRDIKEARRLLAREGSVAIGKALVAELRQMFAARLGLRSFTESAGEAARERDADLEVLLDIAADLVKANASLNLGLFLAELNQRHAYESAAAGDGVQLLTYHKAKGLEWEAVFLPGLEEGMLPYYRAMKPDELEEERRLLYVGITRARTHLVLSWARRRDRPGGMEESRRPSRFVDSLQAIPPKRLSPGSILLSRPRVLAQSAPSRGRKTHTCSSSTYVAERPLARPLLGLLKKWRSGQALRERVRPHVVIPDATLADIAITRPSTMDSLQRVPGMNLARVTLYGAEIIALVKGRPL